MSMVKQNNFLLLKTDTLPGPKGIDLCISRQGKDFWKSILKKYRRLAGDYRLSLYFLQFPGIDQPLKVKNVFSYMSVFHLHPRIRIPFPALVPKGYRITNQEHEKDHRISNKEYRISREFFFSFPSTFLARYSLFDIQKIFLSRFGRILAPGNQLSLTELEFDTILSKFTTHFSSVLNLTSRLLENSYRDDMSHFLWQKDLQRILSFESQDYRHHSLLRVLRAFVVKNSYLKSSTGFTTGNNTHEYGKQYRKIFQSFASTFLAPYSLFDIQKLLPSQFRRILAPGNQLSLSNLNLDIITSKFNTNFSSILHLTSTLLRNPRQNRLFRFFLSQGNVEKLSVEPQRHREHREHYLHLLRALRASVVKNKFFKSVPYFITRTYIHEYEKLFHKAFQKRTETEKEFDITTRDFSDFSTKTEVPVTHLDVDTIASKFTAHFSSVLHSASQLLKCSPGGRPRIVKIGRITNKGEYKQAVSKPIKMDECGGGANTRFAPTKGLRAFVGVNLVFTRSFETACKIRPYKGFWSSGRGEPRVHPAFSVSLLDFITRTYAKEYEKQFHNVFQRGIKKEKEFDFDKTTRSLSDSSKKTQLSITHLDVAAIASKFTNHFSSILHLTSTLLRNPRQNHLFRFFISQGNVERLLVEPQRHREHKEHYLLRVLRAFVVKNRLSPGTRQRPPKSEIFGQALSGRTRGSPLRSPGAWYSANKTGEGRGEPCVRPYPGFPWFLPLPDSILAKSSFYSTYSPTSDYRYWTERKWQQLFITRYASISSLMSAIKTDIFKYISTDVDQAFTIAAKEAAKRSFEAQTFNVKIETKSESKTGTKTVSPELPGLDKEVLESRYTSRFFLKEQQSIESESGPGSPMPMTIKNVHLNLPVENWLAFGPNVLKEEEPSPIEKLWKQAKDSIPSTSFPGSPRTMELRSLVFKDSSKYPAMSYFTPEVTGRYQEAVKKIEKKIAAETERFKANINRTISSASSTSSSTSLISGGNLSQIADNVYSLILEKVKKERKMRGY